MIEKLFLELDRLQKVNYGKFLRLWICSRDLGILAICKKTWERIDLAGFSADCGCQKYVKTLTLTLSLKLSILNQDFWSEIISSVLPWISENSDIFNPSQYFGKVCFNIWTKIQSTLKSFLSRFNFWFFRNWLKLWSMFSIFRSEPTITLSRAIMLSNI